MQNTSATKWYFICDWRTAEVPHLSTSVLHLIHRIKFVYSRYHKLLARGQPVWIKLQTQSKITSMSSSITTNSKNAQGFVAKTNVSNSSELWNKDSTHIQEIDPRGCWRACKSQKPHGEISSHFKATWSSGSLQLRNKQFMKQCQFTSIRRSKMQSKEKCNAGHITGVFNKFIWLVFTIF